MFFCLLILGLNIFSRVVSASVSDACYPTVINRQLRGAGCYSPAPGPGPASGSKPEYTTTVPPVTCTRSTWDTGRSTEQKKLSYACI